MTANLEALEPDACEMASDRTTFQLHYSRAIIRRVFGQVGIGPSEDLDNAYGNLEPVPSDWIHNADPGADASQEDWIECFLRAAVSEAVHEALEWFQVDGRAWLDPHGPMQQRVFDLTDQLGSALHLLHFEAEIINQRRREQVAALETPDA